MIYLPYEPKYYSANGGFETIEANSINRMAWDIENAIAEKLGAESVKIGIWNGNQYGIEIDFDLSKPAPAQDSGIITLEPTGSQVEFMDEGTVIARLTD